MNLATVVKMAVRNVWRNKRRTLITAASIMCAVFFASLMRSLQEGAWDYMLNNITGFHTGKLQIHKNGYWEEQSIDNCMSIAKLGDLANDENIEALIPRIENFALVSNRDKSRGALIIGTDPELENQLTDVSKRFGRRYFF